MSTEISKDLTNLGTKTENSFSILPPALRAAKALNKKNAIGTFEVTLPVLNTKVICKPFSNIDDLTVKTISGSMSAYTDANFKLLYKHAEFSDIEMSFEKFKYTLTEADFRTLLYGIMRASFKKLEENAFRCKHKTCPNPDEGKMFTINPEMDKIEIVFSRAPFVSPSNDHTKDLFIAEANGFKINYKFDNIEYKIDKLSQMSNDEIRNNLLTIGMMIPKTDLTLNYIDSVEVQDPDNEEEVFKVSNPNEIKLFIESLDITSRDIVEQLNDKYIDYINGWVPKFNTTVVCPHCSTSQQWEDIDIYVEFFRKFSAIF